MRLNHPERAERESISICLDRWIWAKLRHLPWHVVVGDFRSFIRLCVSLVFALSASLAPVVAQSRPGVLYALGPDSWGVLGLGTDPSHYARESFVEVAKDVRTMGAGYQHAFFVTRDGVLWVAGKNLYGALGMGTVGMQDRAVPIMRDVAMASGGGALPLWSRQTAVSCRVDET